MAPSFIIATDSHKNEILDLMEEFNSAFGYAFDREVKLTGIEAFLTNNELGRLWIIRKDNETVGYIVLTYGFSFEYNGRDAFIDEFYIEASHRSKGLGGKTLDFISEHATQLGINAIHLEVENDNLNAAGLYKKKGFKGNDRQLLTLRIND